MDNKKQSGKRCLILLTCGAIFAAGNGLAQRAGAAHGGSATAHSGAVPGKSAAQPSISAEIHTAVAPLLAQGQSEEAKGQKAKAAASYQKAIAAAPHCLRAKYYFAMLQFNDEAKRQQGLHLLKIIADEPAESVEDLYVKVQVWNFRREFHTAQGTAERLVHAAPTDPEAYYVLAQTRLYHDNKAAEDAIRKAIAMRPRNGLYWNLLGYIMAQYKDKTPCIAVLKKAAQLMPASPAPWQTLGWVHQQRHEPEEAIVCYKKAAQLDRSRADPIYCLGSVYLSLHRYKEAEQCTDKALALRPRYKEALMNSSALRLIRGDIKGAEQASRKATEVEPGYYGCWSQLGHVYMAAHQYKQATDAYKRAVDLNASSVDLLCQLGLACNAAGDKAQSDKAFAAARKLNPRSFSLWSDMGLAYKLRGQLMEAEEMLRNSVKLAPQQLLGRLMCRLGSIQLVRNEVHIAINTFRKVIELAPDSAEGHNGLGLSSQKLGKNEDARKQFILATKYAGENANYWSNLGACLFAMKDHAGAEKAWQSALQREPDQIVALKGLAVLAKQRGDMALAKKLDQRANKAHAKDAADLLGIVGSLKTLQDYSAANRAYSDGLLVDPREAEIVLQMLDSKMKAGKGSSARH